MSIKTRIKTSNTAQTHQSCGSFRLYLPLKQGLRQRNLDPEDVVDDASESIFH